MVRVNWVLIAARLHLVFKCFLGEDTQISHLQLGLGFQISVKLPWKADILWYSTFDLTCCSAELSFSNRLQREIKSEFTKILFF